MPALIECVPNFSNGRDPDVIRAITARIESVPGATLLHATAHRHEWQTWLRGAGVPDLQGAREQLFDTVDMCVQSAERGLGVAIADAALFTDLIASGKVVKPFELEVDSGNAYFLTYPAQRREQRSIRVFEEWMLGVLRG